MIYLQLPDIIQPGFNPGVAQIYFYILCVMISEFINNNMFNNNVRISIIYYNIIIFRKIELLYVEVIIKVYYRYT